MLTGGCASVPTGLQVDQSDAWIRTEWALEAPECGGRRLRGYIDNSRNSYAGQVRLLVGADDAAGQVEARYHWLPGNVPPNNRADFEVRDVAQADPYRVGVPDYAWYERPNRGVSGIGF